MIRIAKLDRLLTHLQTVIFVPTGDFVPLRFRRAGNAERGEAVAGSRADWAQVDDALVWGEPDGYYWFGGQVRIPAELEGQALLGRVEAQFGSDMGRSDPQLLTGIDGAIAQGGDGNHPDSR